MPSPGQTGLVVPVPAADALLAAVRRRHPDAAQPAEAAHVSLLYPFLPAADIDAAVLTRLRSFAACFPPVDLRLTAVQQAPGLVALDADDLRPMTTALRGCWPAVLPYRGRYGADPAAHLTVAMTDDADLAARIGADASAWLPISAVADRLWLVEQDGSWQLSAVFELNGPTSAPRSRRTPR